MSGNQKPLVKTSLKVFIKRLGEDCWRKTDIEVWKDEDGSELYRPGIHLENGDTYRVRRKHP